MLAGKVHVSEDVFCGVLEQSASWGNLRRSIAATSPTCAIAETWSGWTKTVHQRGDGLLGRSGHRREQVAHQMYAAALPTRLREDLRDGLLEALVGVGDHEADSLEASLDEVAQEASPENVVLRRSGVAAEHVAVTVAVDPDGNDGCDRDDAAQLSHLVEGGIEPHVGILALDGAGQEALDVLVEALADAADLDFEILSIPSALTIGDLAGRHALDVGLDDDGLQRLVGREEHLREPGDAVPDESARGLRRVERHRHGARADVSSSPARILIPLPPSPGSTP